jgi:thiol-disulfide isomerase/thioredoxin/YHS domain-containing protein
MRLGLAVIFGLVVAPTFLATVTGAPPEAKVVWHDDFNRALEEAQRRDCVVLVHFFATWCPPCKRMEREVLNSPELVRLLDSGAVAVKIDGEKQPALKDRFSIEAFPSDVIISPQGRVLSSSQGYQSRDAYLSMLARTESRYDTLKKQNIARTSPSAVPDKAGTTGMNGPSTSDGNATPSSLLALDGYCPVTLRTTRAWKLGSRQFSHTHQGQTYHLLGAQELRDFQAHPDRFAPKFLGCDPVILTEAALAVPGDTRWGAYFDGQLFLFESLANRSRFKAAPNRFVRPQPSLKASDIRFRGPTEDSTQLSSRDSSGL